MGRSSWQRLREGDVLKLVFFLEPPEGVFQGGRRISNGGCKVGCGDFLTWVVATTLRNVLIALALTDDSGRSFGSVENGEFRFFSDLAGGPDRSRGAGEAVLRGI